ncbi:MAG TPA: hypothetical protein VGI07_03600 [Solirubrobacteraceae bacterium]|jgi:hypothetical protein
MPDRLQSERARQLLDLLGLSEDELCATLDVDPLTLLSGQLDHRPELGILLALLDEAEERAGAPVLRRWVRAAGPSGRPIDALTGRDFGAFEDALATLADRGFVLRGGGGGAGGRGGAGGGGASGGASGGPGGGPVAGG